MVEGVLRHETVMEVDRQYVDTHGQSHVGFAFCFLLGFHLLPRLKNLKKQRLYRPTTGDLAPTLTSNRSSPGPSTGRDHRAAIRRIDQVCHSPAAGDGRRGGHPASLYPANVQHPTYRALVELGRALKTAFLCDNFRLESLRREIHAGLNTIETWNSANDFIVYGKGGELREQYGGGPGNVNVGVALAPSLPGVHQYPDDPAGVGRTGVAGTSDKRRSPRIDATGVAACQPIWNLYAQYAGAFTIGAGGLVVAYVLGDSFARLGPCRYECRDRILRCWFACPSLVAAYR